MPNEVTKKKRNTPIKLRSQSCYNKKVEKVTKWHNDLLKQREQETRMKKKQMINPNTKQEPKRKELKELSYYISLIKKVINK
jgi:hypothetical protein